jgi:adenine deaminase
MVVLVYLFVTFELQITKKMQIQGQIVDIENRRIYSGEVTVENGKIVTVIEKQHNNKNYILPGFIDAHIQIGRAHV